MKVIAISGASGCGKTSIIEHLAEKLSCPCILFDDYTDLDTYPRDMKKWLEDGADVSQIVTPRLTKALSQLVSKSASDYIFIEEPFGHCRPAMAELIDLVVLLDLPLELCLSRVIKRHINHSTNDPSDSISGYLAKYDDHMRDIYKVATNQVRQRCDLTIKEKLTVEQSAELIGNWLCSIK